MRALLATVLLLVLPATATAAALQRTGGTLRYTAGPGEANFVSAQPSFFPEGWLIRSEDGLFGPDLPPDLAAAPGCTQSATFGDETTCVAPPEVTRYEILGGDRDDSLRTFGEAALVDGGPGDDRIDTGDEADDLRGGPGDDTLVPGAGADVVAGGDGLDLVSYQDNTDFQPVQVTLDGIADDGQLGDLANVAADVENIRGGAGDDFLAGDGDANEISGGNFANGDDTIDGGGGADLLEGGPGNDRMRARDGVADTVDCGEGTDEAIVDTIDVVEGCETVDASDALEPDRDGDGVAAPADCDDGDPQVRPGLPDVLDNGVDEDCSGADAEDPDRDRDGVPRPADCDDANAAIRPGLPEIRGNAVDEDCSGRANPFARLGAEIGSLWTATARGTRARRLVVRRAPKGGVVTVRCSGGGCFAGTKRVRVREARSRVTLTRHLRGRLLRPRAVVEVRVKRAGAIGVVARFRMRSAKLPRRSSLCLPPGAQRPAAC